MLKPSLVLACALTAACLGCASEKPTVRAAKHPSPVAKVETTSAEIPRPKPPAAEVNIAPDIREICHIEDISTAPKFDFDRYDLRLEARRPLEQLADCLTTGPLRGQHVVLTGRADPRGEDEYNMVLGSSRAASVGTYLRELGVPPASLRETSRGELDAIGVDEAGWTFDRRVDIERAP